MGRSSSSSQHPFPRLENTWSQETLAELKSFLEGRLRNCGPLPVPPEDLVGEILLRLLATPREQVEHPLAYARTALRNLIRDKLRELERARRVLERFARSHPLESPADRHAFEDGEFLGHLLDHAKLSPLQERVIRMSYFENRTITEIAQALGKNPGTILRHRNRALEKLARTASGLEAAQ